MAGARRLAICGATAIFQVRLLVTAGGFNGKVSAECCGICGVIGIQRPERAEERKLIAPDDGGAKRIAGPDEDG